MISPTPALSVSSLVRGVFAQPVRRPAGGLVFFGVTDMARPKTQYRNEYKTRVPDSLAAVIEKMVQEEGISESLALCRLAMSGAFGMWGSLPPEFDDISPKPAAHGPHARA